ncbi:hypothetical protein DJ568_11805 [Mucilaginibacter hurinus]|uniref:Uncharacterized protein n=1 Tax=Mucilaginibacter hurinus TaxID=2201324 RepID=A0A367GLZ7_9SPHI|nr:hypothetical protein [Mucilaginibacter hurinus]RCH54502.1 hypothetical protein DJ568_11805 [Mucilaginibacter hurinus]
MVFVEYISTGVSLEQKVADAHIVFNVAGVMLFLPFIRPIERLLNKFVPDRQPEHLKPAPAEEVMVS